MTTPTSYQPLHPSIRDQLDPEYVAFHDAVLEFCPRSETVPFDPVASRAAKSPMAHGGQKLVAVGSTEDHIIFGSDDIVANQVNARIFTPEGDAPAAGWPCLVWYHGGGWVMGGLGSENGFLTHICKYLRCVVVSVNYRHAPEHMYPTAADDSFLGYQWTVAPEQVASLHLDTSKVALGGLSAGGGLAAIVGMKIASADKAIPKPIFQMLICPVIDNSVTVDTDPAERAGWKASQHSPWLTPTRMQWYRNQYFGTDSAAAAKATIEWTASPCYAPADLLAASPPTYLGIAGCDLLAPEAKAYGAQLAAAGVPIDVQVYAGGTHSVLILAGIHKLGKKLVHDSCTALASAFGTGYDPATSPVLSLTD
ncbi:hypothetical protein SEUCBS139899_001567 [Sporothrix eucalyptigena]|uniref:Alpha/beta hydrolase fold-3 domain-containing protein n=1 Tax=Sporothrix eucalyptigena TaxID=1812306 RepID=A0ABP0BMZ0_9PEZI